MSGKLIVLTGASGVGKTTLANRLLAEMSDLVKLVTYATRDPRPGEQDGVDYNFVSVEQFREMIDNNAFFEHAEVYGQYKGIAAADAEKLLASGKDVLAVIDIQGAESVKTKRPDATTIFLAPDSIENLMARLEGRGTSNEADLGARRSQIEKEMAFAEQCDHTVINAEGQIDQTVDRVKELIEGNDKL